MSEQIENEETVSTPGIRDVVRDVIEEFVRAEAEAVALRVVRAREMGRFSFPEESEPISITRRAAPSA